MAAIALETKAIGKSYLTPGRDEFRALDDIHIRIPDQQFVSLVGPSGCGKTTLLKILGGLVSPTDGVILHRGKAGPIGAGTFGMVFQAPALLPWLTVLENVIFPARILHLDLGAARERAKDLLSYMYLPDVGGSYPRELSGGMQQRVSIARSLLHDPQTLLMDEPFGALDAMTRDSMCDDLQRIHLDQQKTVVFVTHSIPEAILLSDVIYVMGTTPGRVLLKADVELERPRTPEVLATETAQALAARIRKLLSHQEEHDDAFAG